MGSFLRSQSISKLLVGLNILAIQATAAGSEFGVSGDLSLATDYVFRGVSQTMSSAAAQGSITVEHDSGLYGSFWASNVDFTVSGTPVDGANQELDFLLGFDYELSSQSEVSLNWVRYLFPGTLPGFEYNYSEWIGSLAVGERHSMTIAYSPNVFGSGTSGTHYAFATELSLPHEQWLEIELGHYDLQNAYDDSYNYGEISVSGDLTFASWRVGFHATSGKARKIFDERVVRPRVVLTISTEF